MTSRDAKILYKIAKSGKMGTDVPCPMCGKPTKKEVHQRIFCSKEHASGYHQMLRSEREKEELRKRDERMNS